MTISVLTLIPNGGSAKWEEMGLGYDSTNPIYHTSMISEPDDDIFTWQDAAVAGVISKITIEFRGAGNITSGREGFVRTAITMGGTTYYTSYVKQGALATQTVDIAVNPATSAAWTWSEIDNLQAGLGYSIVYGGWVSIYQCLVKVTYTPEAYTPPILTKGNPAVSCGCMMF